METNLFTYHEESILIIGITTYLTFIKRLETKKKSTTNNKNKKFYYFFQLYINSLVYLKREYSENDILVILNQLMKTNYNDVNEDIKILFIKNAINNLNENIINNNFYLNKVNIEWNHFELNKKFDNDKELIKSYKSKICLYYNKIRGYNKRVKELLEDITMLSNLNKRDLFIELEKKYDRKLIYKIIKENNITINNRSKTYCQLDSLFIQLFNNQDNINETITNDYLVKKFSEKIKVSKRTIINYRNDNPSIVTKINNINNYKKQEIIEQVKEEVKIKKSFKDDVKDLNFLNDEYILKFEKVISWEDMELLDSKGSDEWNEQDELEFS